MKRIVHGPHPLFDIAATRRIEQEAAMTLGPHILMQRAGLATARLALALAPHARTIWIACGPGNNGGDGLEAAAVLQSWGKQAVVTWLGEESRASADTRESLLHAREAGVSFATVPPADLGAADLCVDALLGIGSTRPIEGTMAAWMGQMENGVASVLAVDLPSGLDADNGTFATVSIAGKQAPERCAARFSSQNTLSLLTLKPGLFTAQGRDAAGQVWLDDLGVSPGTEAPCAHLAGPASRQKRAHASHKGSYGDVAVIGGATGMTGAALLAASAALHGGAGRVFVGLLDDSGMAVDPAQPELMFRPWDSLPLRNMTVVAGCGGGESIRPALSKILSTAQALVLDADALNAIAGDASLQSLLQARTGRADRSTVLTPHPLEAARLLGNTAAQVQADRLAAAGELARRFGCTAVLKGSGTVIAAPDTLPLINPTGNALLATAGTGDVLAGMIGAQLATGDTAFEAACAAVYLHGLLADQWPAAQSLTASALAKALTTRSG